MTPALTSSDSHTGDTPALTVIMPVYNERAWVQRSIPAVIEELTQALVGATELLVVDDGSTDGTAEVLEELADRFGFTVLHQPNSGRLGARRRGLEQARGDYVMFIDSRVMLRPGALAYAWEQLGRGRKVWNAHVHIDEGNLYSAFWDGVSRMAWREYFSDPRTVSYGLAEFDRYPKGTTCFLAPRVLYAEAMAAFTTFYADERNANDDTSVIRHIAAKEQIWISPRFACDYVGRDSARKFLRHAFARGTVFVDGHFRSGGRFAPVIAAFFPISVVVGATVLRRPRLAPVVAGACMLMAGSLAQLMGLPRRVVAAVGVLSPAFVAGFGAGMWRGAVLAWRAGQRG